jgi:2-(1,2-epoxy-1,2-dihydrophenyl)acetyl-CoA isomerase
MTTYEGFTVAEHADGVRLVTFDRPERLNAMTQGLKRDLTEYVTAAQMDDGVRVLVFTGTGRAFCSGDDIGAGDGYRTAPATVPAIAPGHDSAIGTVNGLRVYSQGLNVAIRNTDKLTIAALNGPAVQTGLSLALSCDFRVASRAARLGSATLRFGLMPDEGGHALLLQQLGLGRTLDFLLRKRIVDADEALALGLVHEVTEPDDLLPRALALAAELANGPQAAMRMLKRAVYVAADATFANALEDIALRTGITDHLPDVREGMTAFREKRPPRFNQPAPH